MLLAVVQTCQARHAREGGGLGRGKQEEGLECGVWSWELLLLVVPGDYS